MDKYQIDIEHLYVIPVLVLISDPTLRGFFASTDSGGSQMAQPKLSTNQVGLTQIA
jgi:hypothetical protein